MSTNMWVGYGLDDRGSIPGKDEIIFLSSTVSGQGVGPTQHFIQWVPGVKRLGRKAVSPRPIHFHGVVLTS
jgi:hypothetical protein